MRILHTSDWHLGRTFHGFSLAEHMATVLAALVTTVREEKVDVVLIAGDIFDHSNPAAELYQILERALLQLHDAGAIVIATSGNHDNPQRLGFQSAWAARAGVHVVTDTTAFRTPISIPDEHGTVDFYPIAYLEPGQCKHLYQGRHTDSHRELLTAVTGELAELAASRGNRSVVIAHCFAAGGNFAAAQAGLHRDLTAGGLDYVAAANFAPFTYAALGHLHGKITLAENIRYSGAPLYFSFKEQRRDRGVWLIDLNAAGLHAVTWRQLPVPRELLRLRGTLAALLATDPSDAWVEATLTDQVLPANPMRQLQQVFPHCAVLHHQPPQSTPDSNNSANYRSRIADKTPLEIAADFLAHVRGGSAATKAEKELLSQAAKETNSAD